MLNKNFGLVLRNLRTKMNLTQVDLSEMAYISRRKLVNLEKGKTSPNIEDLFSLSKVLKKDLSLLFVEYQKFQDNNLKNLIYQIESILSDMNYNLLKEPLHTLRNYKDLSSHIRQYYYSFSGFYYMKSDELDIDLAIKYLNKSLNVNIGDFNIDNFLSYTYSDLELRSLIALADCLRYKGNSKQYLDICEFSFKNLSDIDISYFIVTINYATILSMNKDYDSSIDIINKCIENSCESNIHTYLPFLYYLLYINYKKLNDDNKTKDYLNKSLFLCDCFNKKNLKKLIIKKLDYNKW